ncbi:MAG: hypothetical protein ACXW05_13305 [Gemmatirosa sp.]
MREYRYQATEATIEALRQLRGAWTGYRLAADALLIALATGDTIRIHVEGAGIEPDFEAFRLSAAVTGSTLERPTAPEAFGDGGNDVVVFRSETWIEESPAPEDDEVGERPVVQFTGSPLQRSETAAAVCAVDDAVVVATRAGTGLLVRCGLRPYALEVTTDATAIAHFLAERQYRSASPDA